MEPRSVGEGDATQVGQALLGWRHSRQVGIPQSAQQADGFPVDRLGVALQRVQVEAPGDGGILGLLQAGDREAPPRPSSSARSVYSGGRPASAVRNARSWCTLTWRSSAAMDDPPPSARSVQR